MNIVIPIRLDLPEGRLEAEIGLPKGEMRLVVLAYKMLDISSEIADMAAYAATQAGRETSCEKGCGACCRQLVPLSPPEAAMIYEFVLTMPVPQKQRVTATFSAAANQLIKDKELLKKIDNTNIRRLSRESYDAIAFHYFKKKIVCPFLVDECCSIHAVRPSMCREYLVTSPPENCSSPEVKTINRLPVSIRLSEALAKTWAKISNQQVQLIPLVLALKWVSANESVRSVGGDSRLLLRTMLATIKEGVQAYDAELSKMVNKQKK